MNSEEPQPPRWAQRLLQWYCKPALLEDLQGDLNEYFQRNCKFKSIRVARFIYVLDVFKFMRLYTIRKPRFIELFIHWIMIGSYLKTSGRSLVRNKLFSSINILGLSISMSVGLLLISFMSDMLSYDQFHEKKERIYRVNTTHTGEERTFDLASTSVKVGKRIRSDATGIEDMTILRAQFSGDAKVGDHVVPVEGLWADDHFWKVLTFPLLSGDPATALKEPYSIVLTEKTAKKIFDETEPMGKTIVFDTIAYSVTGVMKDIPEFSHIHFDVLVSFSTKEIQDKDDKHFLAWGSVWSNYIYVLLPEDTDPAILQNNLDKIAIEENKSMEHATVTHWLQPLEKIMLGKDLSNNIGRVFPGIILWILGSLAFIILLSACFNYTNLSIARSIQRSREVGIRKVIGAMRSHVLGQFLSESILIALAALLLSSFFFLLLRTRLSAIAPELSEFVKMDLHAGVVLQFLAFAVIIGILAGFLPAVFFSRINAAQVLKNSSSLKIFKHVSMRKALIVMQYTFSLIFIASTFIGYNQYKSFLTYDLGFSTSNIINLSLQGNKPDQLIQTLSEIPEVENISTSQMVTSIGSIYGTQMKYKTDSANIWFNSIDEKYLPLHGHQFLAGENFHTRTTESKETEAIVTEKVLKILGIDEKEPFKALGEPIKIDDQELTIVAVLKDFHYGKVNEEIEPVVLRNKSAKPGHLNIKINSSDWPATMAKIETEWKKIDGVHVMKASFYDEQIEKSYDEFSAMIKVLGFLSVLAVCISSMGLLGMVVFTTETKLKEISIRKVLGATELNLIYLLSKGFIILLAIAAVIAIPVTYLFFDQIVLSSIAYHAPLTGTEFLSGFFIVACIALLLIGSQTIRVARTNPAEVLKSE